MEDVKPSITISQASASASAPIRTDDEELVISQRKDQSSVWAVKIPRFLLERWERVEEAGVELGSLIIDNSVTPAKISLRLKHDDEKPSVSTSTSDDPMTGSGSEAGPSRAKRARYDTSGIPDEYSVAVPDERSKNTFIFSEKKRQWGVGIGSSSAAEGEGDNGQSEPKTRPRDAYGKRKRDKAFPTLIGKVAHECHIQPVRTEKYLKILEQRRLESEHSRRPIVKLEETGMTQARQNQLATGYAGHNSTFGSKMILSAKANASERHARLERHELIDRIFSLFKEKPYWGIPALKATLKQPDGWMREVLKDVAEQIKEGQYVNMWELKKGWKDGIPGSTSAGQGQGQGQGELDKMDLEGEGEGERKPDIPGDEDEEFDEDDEEDDFEEVI